MQALNLIFESRRILQQPGFLELCDDQQMTEFNEIQTSIASSKQAPTVVPKRCIHKVVTVCSLSQTTCCACPDTYPKLNFMRYIPEVLPALHSVTI